MLLLGLALVACGGDSPSLSVEDAALASSWAGAVLHDPQRFTDTIQGEQAGWIALHANDLPAALSAGGAPAARAHAELSALHAVLSRISGMAWEKTLSTWSERGELPEGSSLAWFAALAALESNDIARAQVLLRSLEDAGEEEVREAAALLLLQLEDEVAPNAFSFGEEGELPANTLLARLHLHAQARRGEGLDQVLTERAQDPLFTETDGELSREFYDPQLHGTLAIYHAATAGDSPPDGLAGVLFSSCASTDSLAEFYHQLRALAVSATPDIEVTAGCAYDPSWQSLGLVALASDTDDAEATRDMARGLQAGVDAWKAGLAENASADSMALLTELQLLDQAHSRILLSVAHHAMNTDRPRQAQALALLARDMSSPGRLSPRNPPSLFAILAESSLRTGHTREALDALEVLAEQLPEVHGLDETVGNLAVLETLGRRGDSKEY